MFQSTAVGMNVLKSSKLLKHLQVQAQCCEVGISALKYFDAKAMRNVSRVSTTIPSLYGSQLYNREIRVLMESLDRISAHTYSLLHIFLQFKFRGLNLWFDLINLDHAHLACQPADFERS
jgi:hypothetical protein